MATTCEERSHRRFALVTACHQFLLRVLPLRSPDSGYALEQFMAMAQRISMAPADADSVLMSCLRVLDRHARRLPGLVAHYLDLRNSGETGDPLCRFANCVGDVLRYQGVRDPTVQRAITFIADRYADATLRPSVVARYVDWAPSQLSTAFSRETGLHVTEYIREVRLMQAARLLTSAKTIKEVWTAVGYNHPSNFDHDFKRRFNASPREYRASVIHSWAVVSNGETECTIRVLKTEPPMAKSVLIVDDDQATREAYGRFLSLEGHSVTTVLDACEALNAVDQAGVDVILLDQRLPDMDGLDCLRALRLRRPGTSPAVAILTADWDIFDYEDEVHTLHALIASKICDLEEIGRLVNLLGGTADMLPSP